jgi:hypothetical protein
LIGRLPNSINKVANADTSQKSKNDQRAAALVLETDRERRENASE